MDGIMSWMAISLHHIICRIQSVCSGQISEGILLDLSVVG